MTIETGFNIDPSDYAVWDNTGELSDVFHPLARYTRVTLEDDGPHFQEDYIVVVGTRPSISKPGVKSFDLKIGPTAGRVIEREKTTKKDTKHVRQFYLNELMHYLLNH